MGPVIDREMTVAEMVEGGILVRATCPNPECSHSRVINPARVCFHPAGTVTRLGLVLRCRDCGRQGMVTRVAMDHEGTQV